MSYTIEAYTTELRYSSHRLGYKRDGDTIKRDTNSRKEALSDAEGWASEGVAVLVFDNANGCEKIFDHDGEVRHV